MDTPNVILPIRLRVKEQDPESLVSEKLMGRLLNLESS